MKNRDLLIGFATGVAATYIIKEVYDRKEKLYPADDVLKSVKTAFKEEGPIDGSWIFMKTEPYKQHAVSTEVYKGGITRHREDELEQFEFLADAYTGAVLEVNKV
ncbi:PepSY domain-containing protein [Planococcus shenhongbingii]|uniref:PepSY domain-containing protein n=1 Tax=Planococcus shenhongbingii TaxID=3058398 RepID=A0ABT8NDU2_9BACL|nr:MULTISPECIES: PepSY domain-containing protein [unclassified Planococcus (in: firmicutes)]MDN7246047.1 PepSY domain-containing protein [Planococcus sp. N017]WKA59823.1 PepSY domain-containing protein [Planococcus sp. N016]